MPAQSPAALQAASNIAGFATGLGNDQAAIGLLVSQIASADWNSWQVVRYSFYDYVRIPYAAATTAPLTFFSVPLGQQDPIGLFAKTLEQTNMVQQGQFGQQYFVIQQLRTHLALAPKARQNATVAATTNYVYDQQVFSNKYRNALSTGVLQMLIGQKLYLTLPQPFRFAPPGFGVAAVAVPFDSVVSATGNSYLSQSNNLSDVYNLSPPQLIEPAQTFQIQITFPDKGLSFNAALDGAAQPAYVDAGVILDGYLCRPVQ